MKKEKAGMVIGEREGPAETFKLAAKLRETGDVANWTNPDTDNDGMPDGWEIQNGLNPLVNDASDDPDGDGATVTRSKSALRSSGGRLSPRYRLSYLASPRRQR